MGYYTFDTYNESVIPSEKAKNNSIMIFDDIACEKQNSVRQYFTFTQHRNVDSFYLAQTYPRVSKHLICDNANIIIMFREDEITDITFEKFYELCRECWKDKYGFFDD